MWEGVLFSCMHENRNETEDRPPLVLISTGKHVLTSSNRITQAGMWAHEELASS